MYDFWKLGLFLDMSSSLYTLIQKQIAEACNDFYSLWDILLLFVFIGGILWGITRHQAEWFIQVIKR